MFFGFPFLQIILQFSKKKSRKIKMKLGFVRYIFISVIAYVAVLSCPIDGTTTANSNGLRGTSSRNWMKDLYSVSPPISSSSPALLRSKRSPFIVAFQVTRPPGLFQVSMKKPVIMGVMSNMTSMLLGSELARMLSQSISNSGLLPVSNTTGSSSTKKKQRNLSAFWHKF